MLVEPSHECPDVNFRALFDSAPDSYLVLAADPPRFTLVAVNEARLRATSTRREDILGRPLFELFPDDPADPGASGVRNLSASLRRVIETRAPHRMPVQKYEIRTAEGEVEARYWEALNSPVFDQQGTLVWIIHRVEEVTKRVRSGGWLTQEEAGRAEEERSRKEVQSILENITDVFFAVDQEWRFTNMNRQAERLLQRPREELLGRPIWEEFPAAVGSIAEREYRRAMAERVTVAFEQYYPALGIWAEVRAYPLANGLSVFLRDVTGRRSMEQALRESEEHYRLLADMIPQYIWTTDPRGYPTYFSRRWYEFTGAKVEQTHGKEWLAFVHPAERDRTLAHWQSSLRTGGSYSDEFRVRGADGTYRWFLGQAMPLHNEAGEIVEWFGTLTDISERKRLEEERERLLTQKEKARALAEVAETRSRFLAEASSILATFLDYEETLRRIARLAIPRYADSCIVYMIGSRGEIQRAAIAAQDPEVERRLNELEQRYPVMPENFAVKTVRSGTPVRFSPVAESLLRSIAHNEEHLRLLQEIGFGSLMAVPLQVRGRTLGALGFERAKPGEKYSDADLEMAQELAQRAAIAIDNARLFEEARAARGEAERRAKEEEALRRAAAAVGATFTIEEMVREIAQSALAATNADGAFVERIGTDGNETEIAAVAGERMLALGARASYPGSLVQRVIERGETEIIPRLDDASDRISPDLLRSCSGCATLVVPLMDGGDPIGALILLRRSEKQAFRPDEASRARTFADLAALAFRKVHMLEEAEQSRAELVRLMESRVRLVRGFSHDVKNPLGAADGFLQLMEEGVMNHLSEKQKKSIGRARHLIRSAVLLIEDLTALARAESGRIEVKCRPVDVRIVVRDTAEEYRARAEAEGLTMEVELPTEFPLIDSDTARVRQILGNLISNAIKYTAIGGITIRVARREAGVLRHPGPCVVVDISDTGPGISPEQQRLLFQEFRRLESAGETTGAGIGLAMSQNLARALGGALTIESELGKGSTFTLWLPG